MSTIKLEFESATVKATLLNNETSQAVLDKLPFDSVAQLWGDEIYFNFPLTVEQADDASIMPGSEKLAYWTEGQAMCIFFGPTPLSTDDEPVAIAPVNPFGELIDGQGKIANVKDNEHVRISLAGE